MKKPNVSEVEICSLYIEGESTRQIALLQNCSQTFVMKVLKRNNISRRDLSESHKKYSFDENLFHIIDNKDKAYWLGFLAADGSVTDNELKLDLATSDKDHIIKFKTFMCADSPIHDYVSNSGYSNSSLYSRIVFRSKILINDLAQYGIVNNKTFILSFPSITKEFHSSYILGLIDADGSLGVYNRQDRPTELCMMQLTSSMANLEKCQEILIENCNLNKVKIQPHPASEGIGILSYGGNQQIIKILKFLYTEQNTFMDRKKNKIFSFLSKNGYEI